MPLNPGKNGNKVSLMMMTNLKFHLTRIAPGRVLLHLGCLTRGGRWDFHWAGIRRELYCALKPLLKSS
jgi:hypothetical protein